MEKNQKGFGGLLVCFFKMAFLLPNSNQLSEIRIGLHGVEGGIFGVEPMLVHSFTRNGHLLRKS